MSEAFKRGERSDPEMPETARETFPLARRLGAFEDDQLVAALTIFDIEVSWDRGAVVRMGGIAGVACAAVSRGRGHVGSLLRESLAVMREWDQPISGLYPFSHGFYRRHGWESVGQKLEFDVPTSVIPAFPEGSHVHSYDGPEALEIVRPIYEAYASNRRGMTTRMSRLPNWWPGNLAHAGAPLPNPRHDSRSASVGPRPKTFTTYVPVYQNPATGTPEGYFTFRYPESGASAKIGEFFALTGAAYRGLLSTMHYYGTQIEKMTWWGPSDDPLPTFITENQVKTNAYPLFMGRIVDVAAALGGLTGAVNGHAAIRVRDERAPWNDGVFEVWLEDGKANVSASAAEPDCEIDIQTLSAAYWGKPSLEELRWAGRVIVHDEAAFASLTSLLPPARPYIQDFF